MIQAYLSEIKELFENLETVEKNSLQKAAHKTAEAIVNGGIVHIFGCGHSHIIGEEVFYRAGGLAPVHPILIEEVMLHKGAVQSSMFERSADFACTFLDDQDIRPNDILIVVSTSGRNPVPIDVALHGKQQGAYVVGITSLSYPKKQSSRHKSGKFLYDAVDLVINNHTKPGDGVISIDGTGISYGPSSSVIGLTIINSIIVGVIERLIELDIEPPVFKSGNIDGSDEHNRKLIEAYKDRIPFF
ncbi:SIS domain-containing protein [Halalkalibacter flavus]|uniref:SIS domain-containing protein n=1 Tax=Halalkalibacter flavus TaxID=3090668 RepID=UPI002FC7CDFB